MTVIAAVPYPGGVAIATDLLMTSRTLTDLSREELRDECIKLHRGNHIVIGYRGKFWAHMKDEFDHSLNQLLVTHTIEELLSGLLAEFNHACNKSMARSAKRRYGATVYRNALALELMAPYHREGLVSVYHNGEGHVYYDAGNGSLAPLIRGGVLSPGRQVEDYQLYDYGLPKSRDGPVEAVETVSSVVRHWSIIRHDACSGLEAVVITKEGVRRAVYEPIALQ